MECLKSKFSLRQSRITARFISDQRQKTVIMTKDNLYSSEKETHFGFQTISEEKKAKKVKAVFENVADRYDQMNDVMSAGVHRVWKDMFMHRLRPKHKTKLLDVAGGTGDIAFRFLKHKTVRPVPFRGPILFPQTEFPSAKNVPLNEMEAQYQVIEQAAADEKVCSDPRTIVDGNPEIRSVVVCDINPKMLEVGKKRSHTMLTPSERNRISWLEADAENLDIIKDNTYDAYTIAFGIRNCVHIDRVLAEAYRVLRPGGRFMCLEFSHVQYDLLRWIYDQYSFQVIPVMGQVIAGDWNSYLYLVESIRKFPDQGSFMEMIRKAGFKFVTYENLSLGVAAIHSGTKV